MARVTIVQAARKDQGTCDGCGKPIVKGESYKWVSPKTGPRSSHTYKRHVGCGNFPRSQLTTSAMGEIYDAVDTFSIDGCEDAESVQSEIDSLLMVINEVADSYEQSASNMEEGFGHETQQSTELRERADGLREWASDLEGFDIPEPNSNNYPCDSCDIDGRIECDTCEGSGVEPGEGTDDERGSCSECGGDGTVPCPDCDETGVDSDAWHEAVMDELQPLIDACPY